MVTFQFETRPGEATASSPGMYVTDISHPLNSARTRAPMQMGMSAGLLIGPAIGGPVRRRCLGRRRLKVQRCSSEEIAANIWDLMRF